MLLTEGTSVVLIVLGVWVLALTIATIWTVKFNRRFFNGRRGENLQLVLEKILELEEKEKTRITVVEKKIEDIINKDKFHLQKVGLVRFNPFRDIGGDHSFSLALFDQNDNGFVLTGLHTRDRTRFYVKEIKDGVSQYELSREEKEAVVKAQKVKRQ